MPKAIQMQYYGDPSVLQLCEVSLEPVPAGEIRFRMIAAAVNRADLEIRSGNWQIMAVNPFPYTPGLEALGEVIEVGAGVSTVKVGDIVITMMQKLGGIHGIRAGGYQELVTVAAANVVATIPPHLDPYTVAALGLAAITAYNGIKRLALQKGDTVVIHGASGGVGTLAVQIAKLLGAKVIATTGNSAKDTYLRDIGADQIVHLECESLVETIGARSIEAVLETIGEATFSGSVAVLKRGGRLCLVGAASGENLRFSAWDLLQDLHLTGYSSENLTGDALRSDMNQLCQWVASGQLPTPPYQKFPLGDAAKVHQLMESRQITGRALLES